MSQRELARSCEISGPEIASLSRLRLASWLAQPSVSKLVGGFQFFVPGDSEPKDSFL